MKSKENDQIFDARLKEMNAKTKLSKQRIESIGKEVLVDPTLIRIVIDATRDNVDFLWVLSMADAGIPTDIILRAWDMKDAKSFTIRNPQYPLQSM